MTTYTQRVEAVAAELNVSDSVAMDILYIRSLERAVIAAAKIHPEVIDFEVCNDELEVQLEKLDIDLEAYLFESCE